MEPDDANLGDVLKERPMTTAETMQVAKAVLAALQALHTSGLVHEHIEPNNVLAVGETVKLRSDCVRECVADGEFTSEESCADLRRKDLHDYGTLLLRCLTLETEWSPAHNNLPDPFKRIIPRALDGSWTLEQIGTALDPAAFTPKAAPRPAYPTQATVIPTAPQPASAAPVASSQPATAAAPASAQRPSPLVPPGVRQIVEQGTLPLAEPGTRQRPVEPEPAIPVRSRFQPDPEPPTHGPSRVVWAICAAVALLLLFLGWHFFSGKPATPAATSNPAPIVHSGAAAEPGASAPSQTVPSPAPPATAERVPASSVAEESHATGAHGWYVVAYTYNHEGQAATKAKRLRRNHDSLHPQVFSPTGHGPYFVSLGGPMSQGEAESVYRHARRAGLPRDTFVRHY